MWMGFQKAACRKSAEYEQADMEAKYKGKIFTGPPTHSVGAD